MLLHTYTDFFLCLSAKFYKSLFWVPILAAGGPYYTKSWVPISFGDSAKATPPLDNIGQCCVAGNIGQCCLVANIALKASRYVILWL